MQVDGTGLGHPPGVEDGPPRPRHPGRWGLRAGADSPRDEAGHGTYLAGIIGAPANGRDITGVAPDARLLDHESPPTRVTATLPAVVAERPSLRRVAGTQTVSMRAPAGHEALEGPPPRPRTPQATPILTPTATPALPQPKPPAPPIPIGLEVSRRVTVGA